MHNVVEQYLKILNSNTLLALDAAIIIANRHISRIFRRSSCNVPRKIFVIEPFLVGQVFECFADIGLGCRSNRHREHEAKRKVNGSGGGNGQDPSQARKNKSGYRGGARGLYLYRLTAARLTAPGLYPSAIPEIVRPVPAHHALTRTIILRFELMGIILTTIARQLNPPTNQ